VTGLPRQSLTTFPVSAARTGTSVPEDPTGKTLSTGIVFELILTAYDP
jgi:hypothetical protein